MKSPYWKNEEAAEFLRCSVSTLNKRRRAGEFVEGVHFRPRSRNARGRKTFLWFPAALRTHVEVVEAETHAEDHVPLAQPSRARVA